MFKNLSIRNKFLLLVLLSAVLPLVIVSVVSIINAYEVGSEVGRNSLQVIATSAANSFESFIGQFSNLVNFLSSDANVVGAKENKYDESTWMMKTFQNLKSKYKDIKYVYLGTSDKKFYIYPDAELPEDFDPTSRPWYIKAVNNRNEVIITDPYIDAVSGDIVVTIAKAVIKDGVIQGVVGIDLSLSTLANKFLNAKFGEDGYSYVVSSEGKTLLHADSEKIGTSVEDFDWFKQMVNSREKSGVISYEYNGVKRLAAFSKLSNGWIFVSAALEKEVNKRAFQITITLLTISAIVIVFSLIFGISLGNIIVKSINMFVDVIEKIGQGDLTQRVDITSKDEIGRMAAALNKSLDSLSSLTAQVEQTTSTLQKHSEQLSILSTEQKNEIEELAKNIDEINNEIQNTSSAIEETTSGVEEVAASAQNVSKTSQNLTEKATGVSKAAQSSEKAIDTIVQIIEDIKEKTHSVSAKVDDLANNATNIGEIVETISSIAEQTNLLALNAAIEAARAGEAGKGFAVVADEIRKLAEESKVATDRIAQILKTIRDRSEDVRVETKDMVDIVNNASNESESIAKNLRGILNEISDISGMIQNLAAIAQEQSAAAEEMASAMDVANKNIMSVSEKMEIIVDSTRKQEEKVNQIKSAGDELSRISEQLQNEVKKFKF
ncbi:MAG: methyl-accepting chemotaxis protein [Thermotogaceae bacterium]|nr:methyl-accepting chemotaxis protein [Thermotogaceae bacterium]